MRTGYVTAKPSKRKRKFGGKGASPDRATASTSRIGGFIGGKPEFLLNQQNHASQPLINVTKNPQMISSTSHQS